MLKLNRAAVARGALLCVPLLGLVACGGGGDGGATQPAGPALVSPASLTPAQAQLLVGRVALIPDTGTVSSLLSYVLLNLATSTAPASGTQNCGISGSVRYDRVDADGNGLVSAGDSITLTGSQCKDTDSLSLDGQLKEQVTSASGGPASSYYTTGTSWQLGAVQTYTNMTVSNGKVTGKLNGTVTLSDSARNSSYRFEKFTSVGSATQNSLLINGSVTFATVTGTDAAVSAATLNDVTVQTSLSTNEVVAITLPSAAQQTLRYNSAGQVVAGKLTLQLEKVQLVVTVLSADQVRVDVDNNRDGTIDATQTLAWTALQKTGGLL